MCQTWDVVSFPVPANFILLEKKFGQDLNHFEVVRSIVGRDAKEFVFNVEFLECVVHVRGNVLASVTAMDRDEC